MFYSMLFWLSLTTARFRTFIYVSIDTWMNTNHIHRTGMLLFFPSSHLKTLTEPENHSSPTKNHTTIYFSRENLLLIFGHILKLFNMCFCFQCKYLWFHSTSTTTTAQKLNRKNYLWLNGKELKANIGSWINNNRVRSELKSEI